MIEAFIIYLGTTILHGAILWGMLRLLEAGFRRKLLSAHTRWFYGFLLLLVLLPAASRPIPRSAVAVPLPQAVASRWERLAPTASLVPEAADNTLSPTAPETPESRPARREERFTVWAWIFFLYLSIAAVLSAKQLRQLMLWRRRVLACPAITQGRVFDALQDSIVLTGLTQPITLRDAGTSLPSPASYGCGRDQTVLCRPGEMDKHSDAELRMLLIHELGHLKYFDNPIAVIASLTARLFWCNPFVALILRRAAFSGEMRCDRLVRQLLQLPGNAEKIYAQLLLDYQLRFSALRPASSALSGTAANLKLRIQEFTMKNNRIRLTALFTTAIVLSAGVTLFSPRLQAVEKAPESPAPTVEEAPQLAALNQAIAHTQNTSFRAIYVGEMRPDGFRRTRTFYRWVDPQDGFVYNKLEFGRTRTDVPEEVDQTNLINRQGASVYSATAAIRSNSSHLYGTPTLITEPGVAVSTESPAAYGEVPCVEFTVTFPDKFVERRNTYWVGAKDSFVYSWTASERNGEKSEQVTYNLGKVDFNYPMTRELFQLPPELPLTTVQPGETAAEILFPGNSVKPASNRPL